MLSPISTAFDSIRDFFEQGSTEPYLLLQGDACSCLQHLPSACADVVITSPPYWQQREYSSKHDIGGEETVAAYIRALLDVFQEVKRVLKPTGSLWLNLGDTYQDKNLCGIPWRVAISLQDMQGWTLRNCVIWHKMKGAPDNAKDKLRNTHEFVFHFVKQKIYYYDVDSIRNTPKSATVKNGSVVTATGVSGINYRRQILRSPDLSEVEKEKALAVLEATLRKVAEGELYDFRMIIRGQQRATHSDSPTMSGRAGELARNGFCILPYHKLGSKPSDVWEIIPEDTWRDDSHYAAFPEELCIIPIKTTCPSDGIVLDPFVGTGTAVLSAMHLQRRAIGIDLSAKYLEVAQERLSNQQLRLL